MLHKILLLLAILLIIIIIIFLNLGKFIDVTQKPLKSDIIVSLGGDSGCRLKTALQLYKDGFSKSSKLIYTGKDTIGKSYSSSLSRKEYLKDNGVNKHNIIHIDKTIITNTMEEVFFIKKYMLKHNLKTVIFVSHPQHSRRISTLAKSVANYHDDNLNFIVVSCNPSWWDKEYYYMNKLSIKVTIRETVKLVYNFIKYSRPLIRFTQYNKKINSGEWEIAINRLNK